MLLDVHKCKANDSRDGHRAGRRDLPYDRDSVADLWSKLCGAIEEHESVFGGSECGAEASERAISLRGCRSVPSRLPSALVGLRKTLLIVEYQLPS